jgi:hypothetical protein
MGSVEPAIDRTRHRGVGDEHEVVVGHLLVELPEGLRALNWHVTYSEPEPKKLPPIVSHCSEQQWDMRDGCQLT